MERRFIYQIILLLFCLSVSAQAKPPYLVDAYLATTFIDSSRGVLVLPANIPWNDISSLYEFAGQVNSNGTVSFSPSSTYSNLVATAHANATRIYITFGGANTDSVFGSATSAATLNTFIANIMAVVNQYSFDGVNIDWEFPSSGEESQFMALMEGLSSQMRAQTAYDGKPKGIDFFGSGGASICGVNWATVGNYVDDVILSGYDYYADIGGITYDGPVKVPAGNNYGDCFGNTRLLCSSDDVNTINGLGFPISKMILGCPLYVDDANQDDVYSVIQNGSLDSTANPNLEMESVYTYNGAEWGTNDEAAFCDKIRWATQTEGMLGIGLWEMSQAYPTTDAPVAAIWNVIGGNDPCLMLGSPTPTPTPVVQSTWRINAGGPAYTDSLGNLWVADEGYNTGTAASTSNSISNTNDPTLYQTQRYGPNFSYTLNVPPGSYQVTLKFAETYFTAAGDREFNVSINGTQVLSNFDIFASAGGENIAIDEVFNNIASSGGQIVITFGPASVNFAEVQALQVIPEPQATATKTSSPSPSLTRSPSPTNSPTRTNTPSPSPSVTPSRSPSATSTLTLSPSNSPSDSPTESPTPSQSPTATYTLTRSPSLSPSESPTPSLSLSPSLSPSSTPTASPEFSPTVTLSPNLSSSPTASPSGSPSQTLSLTASSSPTESRSPSPSLTATPSHSVSPTESPSATDSSTVSQSPSPSSTLTPSLSSSQSPSASPSPSKTPSAISSPSLSPSLSPTPSVGPSPDPSPSPAPTLTPLPQPSPSPSQGGGSNGQILSAFAVPNPQMGPDYQFGIELNAAAQQITLRLFSRAFVELGFDTVDGNFAAGWNRVNWNYQTLPDGLYFVECSTPALRKATILKLLVLR